MAASRALFTSSAAVPGTAARLGRLALPGRAAIDTPNYTSVASRGAVPHLTPDNMTRYLPPGPVYMALEDFIEKKQPPIYKTPVTTREDRLHSFTGLPLDSATIMAARRSQSVTTPTGNTAKSVTLFTSTGFRSLTVPEYAEAAALLAPDVVVPLADLLHTSASPPSKKLVRMVERTEDWVDQFLEATQHSPGTSPRPSAVFAPVLAVEYPLQWSYLQHLAEDLVGSLSGLAVYDTKLLADLIPNYAPLRPLPRLSLEPPKTPHDVLRQVALGVDLCVLPFINAVSDSGVAFTFTFPPPPADTTPRPLGVNMWSEEHATSLEPLSPGCACYACAAHHRAYLRHLLNAKEMLGWTLLQVHNHYAMGRFFEGVRAALQDGTFGEAAARFAAAYEAEFPEGTGERPRARGYHFKSEYGQEKINKTTWIDVEATLAAQPESEA
ncbi:tRNA-guanine transglycosylase family protein [Cordyceps fumosorosea ARSEF 2679]|uniref:Queuine tRNA-ribosyltransferase accessory subunit 2 n=1 Tax=Cordyceps fumosorosea (strain ARSEF 2679) TaxID=1081104 RepID=A0A167YC73_CORFA|nr:tRNA-guanine transglycosylase family protein [Cordyceps fumosorosea ARSEF 2679]OAA66146.1 tRNA-guanine transglycosylase family protein [Cordyceps fumosorosea ARSEF 2679]